MAEGVLPRPASPTRARTRCGRAGSTGCREPPRRTAGRGAGRSRRGAAGRSSRRPRSSPRRSPRSPGSSGSRGPPSGRRSRPPRRATPRGSPAAAPRRRSTRGRRSRTRGAPRPARRAARPAGSSSAGRARGRGSRRGPRVAGRAPQLGGRPEQLVAAVAVAVGARRDSRRVAVEHGRVRLGPRPRPPGRAQERVGVGGVVRPVRARPDRRHRGEVGGRAGAFPGLRAGADHVAHATCRPVASRSRGSARSSACARRRRRRPASTASTRGSSAPRRGRRAPGRRTPGCRGATPSSAPGTSRTPTAACRW